jgi:hypothetical protein
VAPHHEGTRGTAGAANKIADCGHETNHPPDKRLGAGGQTTYSAPGSRFMTTEG